MQRVKPSYEFTLGAGVATIAGCIFVAAADDRLPVLLAWPIETAVCLASFAGMTWFKRNPWGWLWTAYAVIDCAANLILNFVPGSQGVQDAMAILLALGWIAMITMHSYRDEPPPEVLRVIHEHVFHGLPGAAAQAVRGEVVTGSRPAVPVARRLAIPAPRVILAREMDRIRETLSGRGQG